ENLHITFQFIGDTREEDISGISEFLTEHFTDLPALKFFSPILEIIPGRNPRIIWISAKTDNKEILTISKKFKLKLRELGYKLDSKPLKFHVTLGRIKKRLPEFFIHQVLTKEISIKEFDVSEATLYQSFLRPEGPRYVKLYNFLFGGK
ncbi:MAG: RNA 2',3'-cyclic phosphodiesterase, partial [Candidatus Cloacimonetes bacterium]|nr:RNA 2',3'-cyclic phosphodiesterase [Candidatus Cloacimonadota bacterium]